MEGGVLASSGSARVPHSAGEQLIVPHQEGRALEQVGLSVRTVHVIARREALGHVEELDAVALARVGEPVLALVAVRAVRAAAVLLDGHVVRAYHAFYIGELTHHVGLALEPSMMGTVVVVA